jgi:gas vesicle structural protein
VAAVQLRPGRAGGVLTNQVLQQQVTLLELVDRVLNKGVVLSGDITLSVADVDLVYVGLRLLLSSVATLEEQNERVLAGRALP